VRRPRAATIAATFAIAGVGVLCTSAASAATGLPDRDADPVVLKGADVPALLGVQPDSVVAFSYDDGWKQIPVQVDERAVVDYSAVRQGNQTGGRPFSHEAYTDPNTFAGADPDPTLDDGDEIAMMAKDAGGDAADVGSPAGVVDSTRTAVTVSDPLDPGATRFIYLFKTNGGLDPAAGKSYVNYDFSLNSGDYKTTYDFNTVDDSGTPNPPVNTENSTVTTSAYSEHLLGRWLGDGLQINAGDATGVDILDGDKAQVGRSCGRSEGTFNRGGGGYIANTSGPVRAIRSYIGANSGTYTQRDDIYYQRRQDTVTYLRVHAGIAQISQFLDYSAAATGMTYRNSVYPAGVTIDGMPDAGIPGSGGQTGLQPLATWEQVTGPQGALSVINRVDTNMAGFTAGSFYRDEGTTGLDFAQCPGYADNASYGSSGSEFKSNPDNNTDPTLAAGYPYGHYDLTGTRSIFFDPPFTSATDATDTASLRSAQIDDPLSAAAASQPEPDPPVLRLKVGGAKQKIRRGGSVRIPVTAFNDGGLPATGVEVCARVPKHVGKGSCKSARKLPAAAKRTFALKIKASDGAKDFIRVAYRVTADNAKRAKLKAKIGVKGHKRH